MELTLEQKLKKGVEAHKAGKVQEADQYYTAILKADPKNPDANHNMGVLAVGVGKVAEALPFFKTALEVNSSIAQYWLSYIDALIKLDRIEDAKAVFDQAKSSGAKGDAFDKLEQRLTDVDITVSLTLKSQDPPQEQLQPVIDLYIRGQYQNSLTRASSLLAQFPHSFILNNIIGATNQSLGEPKKALEACKKAISIKPDSAEGHNNLGVALKTLGNIQEAIAAFKNAIAINPNYAEAFNNLGNALKADGKLREASKAFEKSLLINSEYTDAYYNLGNNLKAQGQFEEAIESFNKALSLQPDFPKAHNNLGNILREQGKLEEAIESFNKALSLQPDFLEAYNNLGNTLRDQGKLEEAIKAFDKTLSIKPDNAETYNNLGVVLYDQGRLEGAIRAFNKAISIKPINDKYWNNICYPLQALKHAKTHKNLNVFYPKEDGTNYTKTSLDVLHYRLHHGQEIEEICLHKVLNSLSISDSIIIQNPALNNCFNEEKNIPRFKIVALTHFGRSGTGLMHSLLDNHPEIITLPGIYFSEYFDPSTWIRIISTGWDGMIDRFISIYEVLFDASSYVPIEVKSKKLKYNIGINEGMANLGDQKNEVLKVNKDLFKTELGRLMASFYELDAFKFFKLAHLAYSVAIRDAQQKGTIFYHIHNPDTRSQINFLRVARQASWMIMVREPIQSCESWVREKYDNKDYFGMASQISSMLFEVDNAVYKIQRSIGVRLEDLKNKPRKTIPALCRWIGINENESLYEMTAQGKKWWGDPSSPDYSEDGMEPFGKTSINREIGYIFSEKDQFILRTLFYPFSVSFGYIKEDLVQFKADLKAIRPLLGEMFDFEKSIAELTDVCLDKFVKSGSYIYFRSRLIERWNTLNEFHTYPNMIKPLKI